MHQQPKCENNYLDLLDAVRGCRICAGHLPLGPKPVFQWHPDARILIVGQAPGIRAHTSGVPFSDASGERLRAWLGLAPEEFYDPQKIALLPMGFCYPGKGASGDLAPRPECAATWRSRLVEHLRRVEMTLALGEYAHQWYFPGAINTLLRERVLKWRISFPHLVPMPHPSPRNNLWLRNNPWFEAELVPAVRLFVRQILDGVRTE